jgi:uncharacterized protein with von Willebrand factor type A (vWA) domain
MTIIKIEGGVSVETDTMSLDQLNELKGKVDERIDHIMEQIARAKAEQFETGEYADAHWFARAKLALRLQRRVAQQLQEELRKHRIAYRELENKQKIPLSGYFMDVCREKMDRSLFEAILIEAKRRRALVAEMFEEQQP